MRHHQKPRDLFAIYSPPMSHRFFAACCPSLSTHKTGWALKPSCLLQHCSSAVFSPSLPPNSACCLAGHPASIKVPFLQLGACLQGSATDSGTAFVLSLNFTGNTLFFVHPNFGVPLCVPHAQGCRVEQIDFSYVLKPLPVFQI